MTEELAIKIFNHCIEFYTKYCEGEGLQPVITGKEAKAMKIISNLIQKQGTEINKLKRALDEMANTLDLNFSLSIENYKFGKKEKIKEYFMKENTNE